MEVAAKAKVAGGGSEGQIEGCPVSKSPLPPRSSQPAHKFDCSLSLSLVVQFCSWQGLLAQRSRGNSSGCIILPPATSYMETLAENILVYN